MAVGREPLSCSEKVAARHSVGAVVGALIAHLFVFILLTSSFTLSIHTLFNGGSNYVSLAERNQFYQQISSKLGLSRFTSAKSGIPPQSLDALVQRVSLNYSPSKKGPREFNVGFPENRVVSGVITSSLMETAQRIRMPIDIVDDIVDLFGERIDFRRDLQPGDSFSAILKHQRGEDGSWIGRAELIGASIKSGGKLKAIIRFRQQNGHYITYDETGQPVGQYFLRYPVQFSRISSVFSDSRLHPVLKIRRPHNGVDFAAPVGTPVRSVGDGVIVAAGYFGNAGNMIRIQHDKTYDTAYLHLSRISSGIRKGARVARGQVIGAVGSTGLSSGPHLHFSLYVNGKYVDPMKAQLPRVAPSSDPRAAELVRVTLQQMKVQHEAIVVAQRSTSSQQG